MLQNIKTLYILNLLAGIVFWYPIEKLFMQSINIGAFEISVNAVVFIMMLVLFDVPSGVLADKWKRKYVLLMAFLAMAVSSIIGALSNSFAEYIVMTLFLGAFVVLTSGTFQAIMYDTLRDLGREKSYDKHQGYSYALFLTGLGLSSVVGGYMASEWDYRATYAATAACMSGALLLCLTLREPKAHKTTADHKLMAHISRSFHEITSRLLPFQLALLLAATGVLRSTQNEYAALYFVGLGLSAIPIGYATAAKWLSSAVGQIVAPHIGRKAVQLAPLFFALFTLFSVVRSRWSLIFFFTAGFLYAVIANQAEAAIQDVTPSEIRATTLSLLSFSSNVLLIPLSLLFGWVAQHSDIFNAYLIMSTLGIIYTVVWLLQGRKVLTNLQ